jgi:hypothetical protein
LYCRQACRQRAYEHRHGFTHRRTVRALPGQHRGQTWTGTGYEQGGTSIDRRRLHAMRTSVRPEGHRRETLCGLLAVPAPGRHFSSVHTKACATCRRIVDSTPLRYGISASNELSQVRALLDEARESRIPPDRVLAWIEANGPGEPRVRATPSRSSAR